MAYVHVLVKTAIKKGQIVRSLTCEGCGHIRATFAHHDDYLKPLEVRWLCKPCHAEWHRINGPGLNADIADLTYRQMHPELRPARTRDGAHNAERSEQMMDLLAAGWTLQAIADKYGISRERVRQITGSPNRFKKERFESIAARTEEFNQMRRAGLSIKEIEKATGITSHFLNKLGLEDTPLKPFKHGTRNGYNRHKCRCPDCKKAGYEASKTAQRKYRSKGLCIVCGKPANGRQKCQLCYVKWYIKYGGTGMPPGKGQPIGVSGVRNISWLKRENRWRVYRYINRKQVIVGNFTDLEEAKRFNAMIDEKGQMYEACQENRSTTSEGIEGTYQA